MPLNKVIFLILFFTHSVIHAQSYKYQGDPDFSFKIARELAFDGQKTQAQDTLLHILTSYPDYHDIRLFLGLTFSWNGLYKEARTSFNYILEKNPERKDVWEAAINNELWADQSFSALDLISQALVHFPEDHELLYKKASAEINGNNPEKALSTLSSILKNNPEDSKTINYKNTIINQLRNNTIGVQAAYDIYSEVFDPMHYYALKYGRLTRMGSIIARVNMNRRFNENGVQFEVDAYPSISQGLYAYVNIGVSNSFLFPKFRYGTELYKSLPHGLESSVGLRALMYDGGSTYIYTGSFGWYTGNNYFFIRPYFTPNEVGVSKSGTLNYRRYRGDANNYFSIAVGTGYSPEISRFEMQGDLENIITLNSQKFNFGYYFTTAKKRIAWGTGLGIAHQEISFNPGHYFWIFSLNFSCDLKFK